jgi:hypothetical protein
MGQICSAVFMLPGDELDEYVTVRTCRQRHVPLRVLQQLDLYIYPRLMTPFLRRGEKAMMCLYESL